MGAVVCSSQKAAQTMLSTGETSSMMVGSATRQRLASISSNCSSILGLTIVGIANLTDYEKRLIPKIWRECLEQNIYYCDHSVNRLIARHPEVEEILQRTDDERKRLEMTNEPTNNNNKSVRFHRRNERQKSIHQDLVQNEAHRLAMFFNKLITEYDMDDDKIQAACEDIGRKHAIMVHQHGLQSIHWTSCAQSMIHEYKKTVATMDETVEENEMHLLAWTHFVTAVISTIKEAFDQEISPGQSPYEDVFVYHEYFKT